MTFIKHGWLFTDTTLVHTTPDCIAFEQNLDGEKKTISVPPSIGNVLAKSLLADIEASLSNHPLFQTTAGVARTDEG